MNIRKHYPLIFPILAVLTLFSSPLQSQDKFTANLKKRFADQQNDFRHKVWVYFTDKDDSPSAFAKAAADMPRRAAARRADIPANWYDIPVNDEYIEAVKSTGARQVRASRWLNAVSAHMTQAEINRISELDFIRKVDIVATLHRSPAPQPVFPKLIPPPVDTNDYGNSLTQNRMLGIDSLHQLKVYNGSDSVSLNGDTVLIAFLDSGYEVGHLAFDSMDIIDTYDFINDDVDVDDDQPVSRQPYHGTLTLSACGAYVPGELIGPAYAASYALYKTEIDGSEIQIEEDYWVFGAERADSAGADIISSSLGYFDWYTYQDMDGKTAVTTIAADVAASLGILVVTSAGNEGNKLWKYIIAPADGDSVMAVGAVASNEVITAFSSFGPTYDGRVKPEVVAMGSGVWSANYTGGYVSASGTSLSCPLIAGSAALVLQANLSLRGKPMEIRARLIRAGDRYPIPDPGNRYGYGLPDVIVAAGFGLKVHPVADIILNTGQQMEVEVTTLAPLNEQVIFEPVDFPPSLAFLDHGDGTGTLSVTGDLEEKATRT